MIIIDDIEQGSPEWFSARAGVPSASCFNKIVTSKGKRSSTRKAYLYQLAGERMTGEKADTYTSAAMERGIELEAEARGLYQLVTGESVREVALCYKNLHKLVSCSPDGLVSFNMDTERFRGGLEVKCPSLHTHVEYIVKDKLPTAYFQQVQGSLWVTGLDWWDFVSYFPGMSPSLFKVRVYPDLEFHEKLAKEMAEFCADLVDVIGILKGK